MFLITVMNLASFGHTIGDLNLIILVTYDIRRITGHGKFKKTQEGSIYCCSLKATQPVEVGSLCWHLILVGFFHLFQVIASKVACLWLCGTGFPVKTNRYCLISWWILHPILHSSAYTFSAILPDWNTIPIMENIYRRHKCWLVCLWDFFTWSVNKKQVSWLVIKGIILVLPLSYIAILFANHGNPHLTNQ